MIFVDKPFYDKYVLSKILTYLGSIKNYPIVSSVDFYWAHTDRIIVVYDDNDCVWGSIDKYYDGVPEEIKIKLQKYKRLLILR